MFKITYAKNDRFVHFSSEKSGLGVVLDLSHLSHTEKTNYIHQHLPLVAKYRRKRGDPHRILLDESHYFLNGENDTNLLDLELGAYTLVSWRPSELSPWVCKSIDIVVATRLAEKGEVDAVARLSGDAIDPSQWYGILGNLSIEEAALLPPTAESHSRIRRFHVAPRLTQHIRHSTKYQDSQVASDKVFVFLENGHPTGQISATLCELVDGIEKSPWHIVQGHLHRHDFSRWIGHLFGDFKLAGLVRKLESRHSETTTGENFSEKLADLIRDRYESESIPFVDIQSTVVSSSVEFPS